LLSCLGEAGVLGGKDRTTGGGGKEGVFWLVKLVTLRGRPLRLGRRPGYRVIMSLGQGCLNGGACRNCCGRGKGPSSNCNDGCKYLSNGLKERRTWQKGVSCCSFREFRDLEVVGGHVPVT